MCAERQWIKHNCSVRTANDIFLQKLEQGMAVRETYERLKPLWNPEMAVFCQETTYNLSKLMLHIIARHWTGPETRNQLRAIGRGQERVL